MTASRFDVPTSSPPAQASMRSAVLTAAESRSGSYALRGSRRGLSVTSRFASPTTIAASASRCDRFTATCMCFARPASKSNLSRRAHAEWFASRSTGTVRSDASGTYSSAVHRRYLECLYSADDAPRIPVHSSLVRSSGVRGRAAHSTAPRLLRRPPIRTDLPDLRYSSSGTVHCR
jgi:hypothetical protein